MPVRVLLDEQLPRQLAPYLIGHEVRTVQQESWAGLQNGALLSQAEAAGFYRPPDRRPEHRIPTEHHKAAPRRCRPLRGEQRPRGSASAHSASLRLAAIEIVQSGQLVRVEA